MKRHTIKREVDFQIISDWIEPKSKVLDLGCGRGILLEHLRKTKDVYGVGVDFDLSKVMSCIKRGVNVYQGDLLEVLKEAPDACYDWVVCSRTAHEVNAPEEIMLEALRVGRRFALGFVNSGYWLNRLSVLRYGRQVLNEVYPDPWHRRNLANPSTILDFEDFCRESQLTINHAVYLDGSWKTPCKVLPNLFSGYAVYDISR